MKYGFGLFYLAAGLLAMPACSDEEPPVVVPPVTYNQLVRGCILATACGVKAYPRVANCVDAYYTLHRRFGHARIYDAIYYCVNQSEGSCEEVYSCFGADRLAGRCDATFKARCEGDNAVSCDLLDQRVFVSDCTAAKLKCAVKNTETFEAACAYGSCLSAYAPRCDEGRALTCLDGVITVEDCTAQGLVCASTSTTTKAVGCVGSSSTSCSPSKTTPSCKGTVAVTCVVNKLHEEDCSTRVYNRTCKNGVCVATGTGCTDAFDRCQGSNLEYCLDGNWVLFDCATAGFGPCQTETHGARCSSKGK